MIEIGPNAMKVAEHILTVVMVVAGLYYAYKIVTTGDKP